MKKLFTTLLTITIFTAFSFAQQQSGLFLFKNPTKADVVLKVLHGELKLTESQFTQIRDLIMSSAKSQAELFKTPENQTPEMTRAIEMRQTTHIEENMKNIMGADKFKIYQEKKTELAAKVQSAEKK